MVASLAALIWAIWSNIIFPSSVYVHFESLQLGRFADHRSGDIVCAILSWVVPSLVIAEIVLLATHRLQPLLFVCTQAAKLTAWVIMIPFIRPVDVWVVDRGFVGYRFPRIIMCILMWAPLSSRWSLYADLVKQHRFLGFRDIRNHHLATDPPRTGSAQKDLGHT